MDNTQSNRPEDSDRYEPERTVSQEESEAYQKETWFGLGYFNRVEEILRHYNCPQCKKWWSYSLPKEEQLQLDSIKYCPHCGVSIDG